MITQDMARQARDIVQQYIDKNTGDGDDRVLLTDTNSITTFVTSLEYPYFVVVIHDIPNWEDGVYSIVEYEDSLLIGNCMDVYDPDEWHDADEDSDPDPIEIPRTKIQKVDNLDFDEPFYLRWFHKLLGG